MVAARGWSLRGGALVGWLLVAAVPGTARAHPIHTTLAELSCSAVGATLRIRTFADDFAAAVAGPGHARPAAELAIPDAAAARYVQRAFTIRDSRGAAVPLRLTSQRRTGDVVWLELSATVGPRLTGVQLLNAMLFEVHGDQVNIVKDSCGGSGYTTLFSRGDSPKTLP